MIFGYPDACHSLLRPGTIPLGSVFVHQSLLRAETDETSLGELGKVTGSSVCRESRDRTCRYIVDFD